MLMIFIYIEEEFKTSSTHCADIERTFGPFFLEGPSGATARPGQAGEGTAHVMTRILL